MNAPIVTEPNRAQADEAYARLRPELASLSARRLKRINVDAGKTAQRVLSLMPPLRALSGELSRVLPTFDQGLLDKLEDCALVLAALHARPAATELDLSRGGRLLEQATKMRKMLTLDATALCKHGYVNAKFLSKVTGHRGYESTAEDLLTLSRLLRGVWPRIDGKSAVTMDDLDVALTLYLELELVLAQRKQQKRRPAAPDVDLLRVLAVLFRTYAEVRRAIVYLRERDAEVLVPALRGKRWRQA